ncbi:MAG: hypothetical protein ABUL44_02095, partial [Flavobacterium sp.]
KKIKMKKVVFAIQMFVLIAMFPVYLVVELNQKTGSMTVNNAPSEFIEKTEKSNVQPDLNPGYERLSSSVTGANAYYLNQ